MKLSRSLTLKPMFIMCFGLSCVHVTAQTTVLPHFTYKDGLWNTELSLFVSGPDDQVATVCAFDNDGNLSATADIRIHGLAGFHGTVFDLFPELSLETGWLEFSGEQLDLEGIMKFTFLPTNGTTSLPLTRDMGTRLGMLLMENNENWSSGFDITNVSEQSAELNLRLTAFDGTLLQTEIASIPPKAKWVAMLQDVFSGPLPDQAILDVQSTVDITGFALTFHSDMQQIVAVPGVPLPPMPVSQEDMLLDETFRIDISTIEVDFEFVPSQGLLEADARVTFRMRPGQNKALIHLDESIIESHLDSVWLNGQELNPESPADVKFVTFADSWQRGYEFQRVLAPNVDHVLDMAYSVSVGHMAPNLYTNSNDIAGYGGEAFFPTINFPSELSRHILRFHVSASTPYVFIGSGNVIEESPDEGQTWLLDTEREVASYTVMWVTMPTTMAELETRVIDGVEVRIMNFFGGQSRDPAFEALESWLPELRENLGPFPMPRGLSIFLTNGGGGMEYFGGTMTSLWALTHEIFHMYFACSVVAKTYRDSWWDEAITVWYEDSALPGGISPISPSYQSDIVSGRTPITPGFDTRAYNEGAQIMESVARELGGREAMIEFLAYLVENYTFRPFTTLDFLTYLEDFSGVDMREEFQQWLFQGEDIGESKAASMPLPVDMSPPPALRHLME